MSSDQTKLHSWLIDNIEKCSDTSNYVDLNEIKKKYCLPVSSAAIGNCIVQIFRDVTKKKKRCKDDWSKTTQAYYGLSWRTLSETNSLEFKNIVSIVPNDFFVISRLPDKILLGYFTKEIINGNRFMIEIKFESNGQWFIIAQGKTIKFDEISIENNSYLNMSNHSVFETVRQLNFCSGFPAVDGSHIQPDVSVYKEHVSIFGDENSETIRLRSKSCKIVLPFKTSNVASHLCYFCKKSKCSPEKEKENSNCTELPLEKKSKINENKDNEVSEEVTLNEGDNGDMTEIFNKIFPDCSVKMQTFLLSQKMALERHPFGRRWNKEIIRLCLTLWCRSPKGYIELRNSNFLILPSHNLLQRYKNSVEQKSGINKEILHWMANEAKIKNIPPEGYKGGLMIDEMSIQPDLQFRKKNGDIELIGFTECTPDSIVFENMKTGKSDRTLATHVLQLVFLGFTGFRFPFAHFPTTTATGYELYLLLWKSVQMLSMFGFCIEYVSTDGAQSNRDMMKLLLPGFDSANPITCSFQNVYNVTCQKLFFIMDFSHVIKKSEIMSLKVELQHFAKNI
ncbi:unnamed protein product [Mytilus edulis]|uniref:Transposable element P transposase-like RNase H domain-containing protein n=1 Tax=Mytilus edulis TaxID=6550 RepID=A0A8S3S6X2_MYTED|nr:unnamed protein product [Mytilus edulis]